MRELLIEKLRNVFGRVFPDFSLSNTEIEINYPPEEFGDYSTNLALKVAKELKKNPREIAELVKSELEKEDVKDKIFSQIEVAGAGFLNFSLSAGARGSEIEKINSVGEHYGDSKIGKGKKIHLDFVSANPTGPIHLGNGRGGPLGDTLANILIKNDFSVWREFYVNDFGNQIRILGHSILKDDEAQYRGKYIDDLAKKNTEPDPFLVGQMATETILDQMIRPAMESLGIFFNDYFRESSLHKNGEVEKAFEELKKKDLLYEKDGALWFRAEKFGDEKDRVVKKTTGEITYFGGDVAYHLNKLQKRKFDLAIDIWGADHHGDVARVQGVMDALGYPGKVKVLLTQNLTVLKNGEEFKMSKRKGQYICLEDLIDEVGKDAVRFIFLAYSANSPMIFDIDLAREKSNKNPVYYVQYAYARMAGILRKTEKEAEGKADFSLLTNEKEIELARHLMRFPDLILEIAENYEVHRITHYAIKLADKFHSFYHTSRILDEEKALASARRELVSATKVVLGETLRLVGIGAPDKM
ncbi:MAG: arginine--tRNA ligase [Candidatus Moranbacteria bacterium]|nr:arginine--tRNA ligase [Candidatus Moranbacteria bacterium]